MQIILDAITSVVWTNKTLAWIGVVASVIMGFAAWRFAVRYQALHAHASRAPKKRALINARSALPVSAGLLMLCGLLGAADPEYKVVMPDVQYVGACVGISVDASYSTLAPERRGSKKTRLARALGEIETLANSFPTGDRLSLMAFAGAPEVFSPKWTNDRHLFFVQLRHINESYVAVHGRSGSDIASAVGKWFTILPAQDSCQIVLIVFTDGEAEGEEAELAQQLISSLEVFSKSNRRVVTFLVAIGDDREESRIPEYDSAGIFKGFAAKSDGSYIFTRPDIFYLKDIAARFHGKLIFAERRDENLQQKISASIAEARKIAAIRSKITYQSAAPWLGFGFLGALTLLLAALVRL